MNKQKKNLVFPGRPICKKSENSPSTFETFEAPVSIASSRKSKVIFHSRKDLGEKIEFILAETVPPDNFHLSRLSKGGQR